jgi:coniferyl-aldehyde dehydrogenase
MMVRQRVAAGVAMSAVLQAHPPTEVERALRAAFDRLAAGFEAERDPSHAVRTDRLRRLEAMLTRMAPAMVDAISADFGHRPAQVTQLADITPVLMAAGHARGGCAAG